MTYKRQPEVIHECQVIIYKGSDHKRCTRKAKYTHGAIQMCRQHHDRYMDRWEQERLRLKDKYAGEQT